MSLLWNLKFASRLYRSFLKKELIKTHIAPTNLCNSRCKTCLMWKNKQQEEIKNWDFVFSKLPNSVLWLSISGGEPGIRNDLREIVNSAIKIFPKLMIISINTNGLIHKNIIKAAKTISNSGIKGRITISLDAIGKDHDKIRGVSGNFEKAFELYYKIKKIRNIDPGFETTISKYNQDKLQEINDYLKKIKIEHMITIAFNNEYYGHPQNSGFQVDKKIIKDYKKSLRFKLNPFEIIKKSFLKKAVKYENKSLVKCCAGVNSIYIDWTGDVFPCISWNYKIGEKGEIFDRRKNAIRLIEQNKCFGCWTPCDATLSLLKRPWRIIF